MAFACYYMSLEGASESQRMSAILIAHGLTFLVGLPFTFVYPPELSAAPWPAYSCSAWCSWHTIRAAWPGLGACPPLACSLLGAVEPLLKPRVGLQFSTGEAPGLWALIAASWSSPQ